MAVIFGRTATTRLNNGVNVVVTPDNKIIAPVVPTGFQPGDFDFTNVTFSYDSFNFTNTVTFTKSGRLYITGIQGSTGIMASNCYVNGFSNILSFWSSTTLAENYPNDFSGGDGLFLYMAYYAVLDVNINDTMQFEFVNGDGSPFPAQDLGAIVNFKINSFSGTQIDSFTIDMTY